MVATVSSFEPFIVMSIQLGIAGILVLSMKEGINKKIDVHNLVALLDVDRHTLD